MAEVGLPDSGGDDEVVIAELEAVATDPPGQDPAAGDIKIDDLSHTQLVFFCFPSRSRSGAAIFPSDMMPVAHW